MPEHPVLAPIESVRCQDAILDLSDPKHPKEPEWPEAEFIVGNPPFLGNKQMRSGLGEQYVSSLWALYHDRLPPTSNLCCYWFEKARALVAARAAVRAGLLATTTITQASSRKVLERIGESSKVFFAISDQDWMLDGASVRISMVGFCAKDALDRPQLDGQDVPHINPDLTSGRCATSQRRLKENVRLGFMGVTKVGDFDIEHETAVRLLSLPNPDGRPNSDVIRPFRNGSDLVRVCSQRWIIDYGVSRSLRDAALYEGPFQYLVEHVKEDRLKNNRQAYREKWWIHAEARPGFRERVAGHPRYIATARVAKHRIFVWLDSVVLPDSKIIAIAKPDEISIGVLQSRIHEAWTNAGCGMHGGERRTYNPNTCFETFPFPETSLEQHATIAAAAKKLDDLRCAWLNPPEWTKTEILEFPGSVDGPWARYVVEPDSRGMGTVRWPRLVPKDADCAASLQKRTLTNLYNQRPAWLDLAHRKLDEAVFAAYGWAAGISDEELLEKLLALNLERAG
jgi:type II restriction/modification system DNA methylase subunit YeeA